ncbi:MAG: histidinol phosphate phosphatase domain-containing protein [Candidatus Omnitrophota bacterium]
MIDLHTHSILSDGELIPSELARRAQVNGCRAIAITDHADHSNIEIVLSGLVKVSKVLNKYWDIFVIPGVEITHVPVEAIPDLVRFARKKGAGIVVGHGESPVEPVIPGTNAASIKAGVDILAHPGFISEEDARLAASKGVYLEITSRKGHSEGNKHVFDVTQKTGANLVLCTDTHSPEDMLTPQIQREILASLTASDEVKNGILANSGKILEGLR